MNTITYPMIWDSKICGQFDAAKRRAKTRVKDSLPNDWGYKIDKFDSHKGTMTSFDRYWSIKFSKHLNSIHISVSFNPCRQGFDVDTWWFDIHGHSKGSSDVQILLRESELLKKVVEEILVEMNPKNYGG